MGTADHDPSRLAVALAQSDKERKRLYRFRYQVAIDELNHSSPHADHDARMLHDDLDESAALLLLTSGREPIATIRVNFGHDTEAPPHLRQAYQLDRFETAFGRSYSFTSRLLVASAWRIAGAAKLVLGAAYKLARERGARFDFCHCSPALVPLYERLGYRQFGDNFVDEADGYRMPMVLTLEDVGHLNAVRSPFFALGSKFGNTQETTIWFANQFGQDGGHGVMDEDAFWQFLTDRLLESPSEGIPILEGLGKDEAKRFLALGTVLRCRPGDVIVRAGDVGNEMFVVLSGTVDVRGTVDGVDHPLASLGKGEVFGELGFLGTDSRIATVVATSDLEVLVLTQGHCRKAMTAMPEVAVKVLLNLSLILCERLSASTQTLLGAVGAGTAA